MSERIKGTIIEVGTINSDGTLGTGWVFDGHGGVAFDIEDDDGQVYVCGYTLAELREAAYFQAKRDADRLYSEMMSTVSPKDTAIILRSYIYQTWPQIHIKGVADE